MPHSHYDKQVVEQAADFIERIASGERATFNLEKVMLDEIETVDKDVRVLIDAMRNVRKSIEVLSEIEERYFDNESGDE